MAVFENAPDMSKYITMPNCLFASAFSICGAVSVETPSLLLYTFLFKRFATICVSLMCQKINLFGVFEIKDIKLIGLKDFAVL